MKKKKAVVTGGTKGIGYAIAKKLCNSGVECTITGRSEVQPEKTIGDFSYVKADFRVDDDIENLADFIQSEQPEILINNAGINTKGETKTYHVSEYDSLLGVNLKAPFILCQAAIKGMEAHGWGRIVNITSLWGLAGNKENAAYCASKFGLSGLTASLAAEVVSKGIIVNAVAPGVMLTEDVLSTCSAEAIKAAGDRIPMGRLGDPKEVANLVAWLVSDENTYMTGQNLLIDGGLGIGMSRK